ncbi:MAG: SpoIIE family protein phosphatase [Oscillospiraceae bacterium]|nr:SpoIIE family protein phosphatase [Oscillospiraceae bacterium]MBR7009365.1 SpoIIE family protein phosphatase [Oscillospiraceae bacterium]
MEQSYEFFSRLIGTLAVMLLVAAFAGNTRRLRQYVGKRKTWSFVLLTGLLGGLFGVYGNISGVELNGAVISVRDVGPMLGGFLGGPVSGLIAGAVAGVHRLIMGGLTAEACVAATCSIGLLCGLISALLPHALKKLSWILLAGAAMECLHLGFVLLLVKPFSAAWEIVRQIAIPFITVNAAGIASMMGIMRFVEKQQAISLERERMKSELEVASVIQHSLLPPLSEKYPGRAELAVSGSMQAAREVGGDFYDVFFVDADRIAFLIGDVSGKGVPAALFMAASKVTLQNCIRDIPSLSDALLTANNSLVARNEADMFVTLWAAVLDLKTGKLRYACAGHNPPVLIRNGVPDYLKSPVCLVLACLEDTVYPETELQLQPGDALFLYTDGVTEASDGENELYGGERLLACLQDCADADVQAIPEKVQKSVEAFVRDREQFDDITMLCVKWK